MTKLVRFLKKKYRGYLEEKKFAKFYSQFINKNDLVFDIGANVGNRTGTYLQLGRQVIAVEPQARCVEVLNDKFSKVKSITIVNKAVGEKVGLAEMTVLDNLSTISSLSEKWVEKGRFSKEYGNSKKMKVSVTTLDDLIDEYGLPNFCKIDVEGYELEVIKGLSKKVPYLSFEFTKEFLTDARECLEKLDKIGDIVVNASYGESMQLEFSDWISPKELLKKLEDIKNPTLWGDIYVRTS